MGIKTKQMKKIVLLILAAAAIGCTKAEPKKVQAYYSGSVKTFHDYKIDGMKHAAYEPHIVEVGSMVTVTNAPYFKDEIISLTVEVNDVVVFYEQAVNETIDYSYTNE